MGCDHWSVRSAVKWFLVLLLAFIFIQYSFNVVITSKYIWVNFVQNQFVVADNGSSAGIRQLIRSGLLRDQRPRHGNGAAAASTHPPVNASRTPCPLMPPQRVGRIKVNVTAPSLARLEAKLSQVSAGGRWWPSACRARHRVAVIIPYRDRDVHLRIFLQHMHPFLQSQQLDYGIYVIEQAGTGKFNRAMLMNIGYNEARQLYAYDCYVFHDVDLLPEDDRNIYSCPDQPRHMSASIDVMNYRLPYNTIFGGVSALKTSHVIKINGFSNKFFGWGGEDDDLYNRVVANGLHLIRYPIQIARYKMVRHKKDKPSSERYKYLYSGKKRFKQDGVNSLLYKRLDLQKRKLYTWVHVSISEKEVQANPTAHPKL